jgi:PAS domain S-box-containing protein
MRDEASGAGQVRGRDAGVGPGGGPSGGAGPQAGARGEVDDPGAASEELAWYRQALDQSAIVAVTDVRGTILHVNDRFCEVSGFTREELLGEDHRILNSGLHPKAFFRDLWRTIGQGEIWRGELRNRRKDGSHYWVDTTIVPQLNGGGKPEKYIAIRNDITERKDVETRLRAQETMAQLGEMAAVIAHEVRNPLAGISGAIQVIAQRLSAESSEARVLREVIARVGSLNDVLTGLLDFARPCEPRMRPCRARELVEKAAMFLADHPDHQHVALHISGPDARIVADADLLGRALLNLVINAAQACAEAYPEGRGGRVVITLAPNPRGVDISVSDNGKGIPEEALPNLFRPFFTTRVKGTGLGLAVVKQAVDSHGGSIAVTTAEDGGARFAISLPDHSAPEAA